MIEWFVKTLGLPEIYNLCARYGEYRCRAVTAYAFFDDSDKVCFIDGAVCGQIVPARGDGWGWDPIFQPEGSELTFAEMTLEYKQKHSMRAKALAAFVSQYPQ